MMLCGYTVSFRCDDCGFEGPIGGLDRHMWEVHRAEWARPLEDRLRELVVRWRTIAEEREYVDLPHCSDCALELEELLDARRESRRPPDAAANREGADIKWQQIEAAPQDGTWILAYVGRDQSCVVKWDGGADGIEAWRDAEGWLQEATHWMPLPTPPAKETPE